MLEKSTNCHQNPNLVIGITLSGRDRSFSQKPLSSCYWKKHQSTSVKTPSLSCGRNLNVPKGKNQKPTQLNSLWHS